MKDVPERYSHGDLVAFAARCLVASDVDGEIASVVARRIVDADLFGHDTHGLALLPRYLMEIEEGITSRRGRIKTVCERGPCLLWDAGMLPGHWVLEKAFTAAMERVPSYGVANIAVRRCQHVGALQVYLTMATDRGYMCVLWVTDSQVRSVAPFGGLDPVLTSEPIAAGIPTRSTPILVDTTTSLTSNGYAKRAHARGEKLPWPALLSAAGEISDDPSVLFTDPPGTILPLGGITHGHKGYAMAMLVSAMSLALPGFGRLSGEKAQGFFLQLIDPDAFAGRDAFLDETEWMAEATRNSRSRKPGESVRVPGDGARTRAGRQMRDGLHISREICDAIAPWARKLQVQFPEPLPQDNPTKAFQA